MLNKLWLSHHLKVGQWAEKELFLALELAEPADVSRDTRLAYLDLEQCGQHLARSVHAGVADGNLFCGGSAHESTLYSTTTPLRVRVEKLLRKCHVAETTEKDQPCLNFLCTAKLAQAAANAVDGSSVHVAARLHLTVGIAQCLLNGLSALYFYLPCVLADGLSIVYFYLPCVLADGLSAVYFYLPCVLPPSTYCA